MKILYTIILVLITVIAQAQLVNPDFEEWIDGSPVGWVTSIDSLAGSAIQSDSAYSGMYALQLSVVHQHIDSTKFGGGYASTDNHGTGSSDPNVPYTLTGWFKLISPGNDLGIINVTVTSNGVPVGQGYCELPPQDTGYRQFTANITYNGTFSTIDFSNVSISFQPFSSGDTLHKGTVLTIDDLAYNLSTGVNALFENSTGGIESVFPNPSKGETEIIYNLPVTGNVNMGIYDILGREQTTVLNGRKAEGKYRMDVDTRRFAPGVYFVKLLINNVPFTSPLVVN